jgi:O-antigen ligase
VLIGAFQYTKGNNFMPFEFLERGDYGIRASGFYVCPNHLAGFLEVVALMGLSVACWSRWKPWARLLVGYLSVTCVAGIMMTGSRGGYLSTAVGVVVLGTLGLVALRKQNKWLYWRVLIGNLLLAGILVFGVTQVVAKNWFVQSRASNIATTQDIRLELWKSAIEQFQLDPIWGTGSRTFLYYGRQFRPAGTIQDPIYAHNDYLQLLAEFGVVGMLGFLLFLAVHLRSGIQSFVGLISQRTTVSLIGSNSLALNIGALASVAAYMVHSFLDFNLHIPANSLLMAFTFGLLTDSSREIVTHGETELMVRYASVHGISRSSGGRPCRTR